MMIAVLPTPALPISIAPCERASRLSIQKLIEAVSPVGTVTSDIGVVAELYEMACTLSTFVRAWQTWQA